MAEPGELIQADDYALSFRTLEPRPETPASLLVLLHGVGADESQPMALADGLPGDVLVVLPRGYRSISGGKLGWYRIGLSDDGLQVVEDEEREARSRLVDFLGQLQSRFDVPPSRTVVGGFSQGGILAASAALTAPERVAAFFMVAGRLLPDVEPATGPALEALTALVVHGRQDETLPVEDARAACDALGRVGIETAVRLHDAGHELTEAMRADARAWLRKLPALAAR